jgi:hypothetical protein
MVEAQIIPKEYTTISKANNGETALESFYVATDFTKKIAIRDEFNGKYLVFDSRADFLKWSESIPEHMRCFHEVIFGTLPQKLKFDIDAPMSKLIALPDKLFNEGRSELDDDELKELLGIEDVEESQDQIAERRMDFIMEKLIDAIFDELSIVYGIYNVCPMKSDLAITDSSGPTPSGWKFSYHIVIVPYIVADNNEAKEFSAGVIERMNSLFRVFIDPSVNKSTQNFRIVNSTKPNANRYKRITDKYGTALYNPEDLFITAPYDAYVLPRAYTEKTESDKIQITIFNSEEPIIKQALELANKEGVTIGHTFTEARGTLICFKKIIA